MLTLFTAALHLLPAAPLHWEIPSMNFDLCYRCFKRNIAACGNSPSTHVCTHTHTHIISIFVRMFWFSPKCEPSYLILFWHTSPRPYLFACVLPGFVWSVCSRPGGVSSSFPRSACHVSMPFPVKTSTFCAIGHSHNSIITATTRVLLKAS